MVDSLPIIVARLHITEPVTAPAAAFLLPPTTPTSPVNPHQLCLQLFMLAHGMPSGGTNHISRKRLAAAMC